MKGLYIHIPFCIKKCLYCDFVSLTGCEDKFSAYIDALINEAQEYKGECVDTVFIGGGTPTVLSSVLLDKLLKELNKAFKISSNAEITCECNPGTLSDDKLLALVNGGVNRISMGVQSFNDNELTAIGRIHNAQLAYNAVNELREKGIHNINIDLMTALPSQTPQSLARTLEIASELPITHISAYSLIIEDGTPLEREYSKGNLILPDEDADREMYRYAVDFLTSKGFQQYEISNFAKKGFECKHNIKYWDCDEYIGLGAAAHSYVKKKRFSNSSDITEYMNGNKRDEILLSRNDEISEFMMLGLRKIQGINKVEFKNRFKTEIEDVFGKVLERFLSLELLENCNENYRLTKRGIDVSNSVMCEFIL